MEASLGTNQDDDSYQNLSKVLDEMVKLYRNLLDAIRKEKNFLIAADLENLNKNNEIKEGLITKIKAQDLVRERYSRDLAKSLGLNSQSIRLLEISKKLLNYNRTEQGERLTTIHSTLTLMIERVSSLNKENEVYARSALKALNVAMGDVKETLGGKKTYERKGKMQDGPNRAGNFVSKEV